MKPGTEEPIAHQEQQGPAPDSSSETTVYGASASEYPMAAIISSTTREDLYQQFTALVAEHDGHTLTAGAVARKVDGTYIQRIDII